MIDHGFTLPLDGYPIHDEAHRDELNRRIIEHYMMDEIGYETVDMFLWNLRRKMNEIMPYYKKLYETELIHFDPLQTVNIQESVDNSATSSGTNTVNSTTNGTNNSTNSSTTNSQSRAVSSETPQTRLAGDEDYATGATDSAGTSQVGGTSEGTTTGTEATEGTTGATSSGTMGRSLTGSQGVASDLLTRYRETILNIDMAVVNELRELFMSVWDTGDDYTESRYGYGYWPYWFAL